MSEQSQSNPTVVDETPEVEETVLGAQPEVTDESGEETEAQEYSNLTPYAAAELANRLLGVKEGDKPRTSQTFYSLARNGTVASNYKQWVEDGARKSGYKVEFEGAAFMQWLQDSAAGKIRGRSRNNYDRLAEEFSLDSE
jgi:hypothetical protein